MSSSDGPAPTRRAPDVALTIGVGATVLAALMPLLGVITLGAWYLGVALMVVLVLAAGYGARRFQVPAVAVTIIEAAVWLLLLTMVFGRGTALLGFIPTPETFREVPGLIEGGMDEVMLGSAPLEPGVSLAFLIVGAVGLLVIVVDHVVLTARMPLLAAVGLIAVSLIPAISVPSATDLTSFVLLSAGILYLIRAETRSRELRAEARAHLPPREAAVGGISAMAAGIGAIGVVVAISATPLIPLAEAQPGAGFGPAGNTINPSLELGNDLRQPLETEVLRLRSDSPFTPYLRAVTLSEFTGRVWLPDSGRTYPLDEATGLGPVMTDEEVRVTEFTTTIEVVDLRSPWLPVAFPAVAVTGLEGDWAALPYNRTLLSNTTSSNFQQYEVVTHQPRPTLEQIQASDARGGSVRDTAIALPERVPPIIEELAREVTAGAENDYDALEALQRWFRGTEFEYSLEAPVSVGFDGSGLRAIEQFLDVRSGYCVHFASAFAVMARVLDMPSRIVVGYLPGTSMSETVEGETLYSVSSSQLHAWPEVYFEGIGWIPFEPTSGRGIPTTFAPESAPVTGGGTDVVPDPVPGQNGANEAPLLPEDAVPDPLGEAAESSPTAVNPLPGIAIGLGAAVLLAIPALVREWRRRSRVAAAHGGDAGAAWRELQDMALDLGIEVPGSETPRTLGARLVARHGAPADAVQTLITGIELASYARGSRNQFARGPELADAVTLARARLLRDAEPARRILAVAVPRSLVIRPGSVYAGDARAPARAR